MRLLEHFFKVIAPSNCLGCQTEGSLICLYCVDDLFPTESSRCYMCNKLTKNFAVCPACRRKTPLRHVFTRAEYTEASRELVHKMKFSYSGEAADIIARELLNTIPSLPEDTLIVPVPTITSHVRQRGLDHTKRIARELSSLSSLRFYPALLRLGQHRQVGSKRSERISKVAGSFRHINTLPVADRPILLVDDVLTTGSTLNEAAETLKLAGAKHISAVVFARAK